MGPPKAFPGGAAGVGRAEAPVACETVAAVAVRGPGAGPGVAGGRAGPLGRTRTCGGGTPVVVSTARPPGLARTPWPRDLPWAFTGGAVVVVVGGGGGSP